MADDEDVPPAPTLYRAGDLAERLPDGNLRFRGRRDRQASTPDRSHPTVHPRSFTP
jgi:non-ribosomal peptide synthetase component F